MIYTIIQSYLGILLSLGIGAIIILSLGLYWIFSAPRKVKQVTVADSIIIPPVDKNILTITSHDLTAIAGDDVIATQLDLARAYIETGRNHLAKKMLQHVAAVGNAQQQHEAQQLLSL